jgi:hypothetical protein
VPVTTAAVSRPSGLTGTDAMIQVEDVARDPGEHGRPATAQDPANRATFPGGRDGARGRAGGAGLIAVLVSDAAAPVSGAILPADGAQAGPGAHTWAGRTEASSRMACACPWSVTLMQPRNHRDRVTAFHLASGEPGPVAKARTAARDVPLDPGEIP